MEQINSPILRTTNRVFAALCLCLALNACESPQTGKKPNAPDFKTVLDNYWEERMQLFPLEATANGDKRYNDRLTITIAQDFRDSMGRFFTRYLGLLDNIDTSRLNEEEKTSFRLLRYEMQMGLSGLKFPSHYLPVNQFWAFTLDLPQLGSGEGNQPFKTIKDYDDFLKRLSVFPAWTDTAINNMRQGIQAGWVLPKTLVIKILPQLKAMVVPSAQQSIFYGPIAKFPADFSAADKKRLTGVYTHTIDSVVIPCYSKLYSFFEKEYLPVARESSGISELPGGREYYDYCIKQWTTLSLPAEEIYNMGVAEVERLTGEMNRIKDETGFKGDLQAFFVYVNEDRQFFPFTTPQQVLDSFKAIKAQEEPYLKSIFDKVPSSPFNIRQTEAFRAASASAEYNPASEDGSRPGIFYVPILDAKKFNAVGMETLFLHEAIPGHHYQISLQQENKDLPKFRRFLWYGAYGEGWALYSETLGTEVGLFKNPYQYFGHLGDAMHRAIRLVVDVGIHTKGMTREEAIAYMMAHEPISEEGATAEIERYMAIPGQALSYKTGQLTISAEREKYEQELGDRFRLNSFHNEVLKHGCVPLEILQEKLALWAKKHVK